MSPSSKCALCPVSGPAPPTTTSISLVAQGAPLACPARALLASSPGSSPSQQPRLASCRARSGGIVHSFLSPGPLVTQHPSIAVPRGLVKSRLTREIGSQLYPA